MNHYIYAQLDICTLRSNLDKIFLIRHFDASCNIIYIYKSVYFYKEQYIRIIFIFNQNDLIIRTPCMLKGIMLNYCYSFQCLISIFFIIQGNKSFRKKLSLIVNIFVILIINYHVTLGLE